MLGLLDTPTSGGIALNGHSTIDINQGRLAKIRRDNIGFVFQQFLLLPTLTVRENIELPLLFSKKNGKSERVTEIMGLLGLAHRAEHLPHQLSGGEMQRVSIGRALINEPKLILADEPTGNLDSATAEKIFELFRKLNNAGLSLVVVTHNVDLAKIAHRVIGLKDGTIAAN
jgi:putative ABC transport system ATP-binding protein